MAGDYPPPGTALVEELDRKLLIQLRDGRKVLGTLRSFDQVGKPRPQRCRRRWAGGGGQEPGEVAHLVLARRPQPHEG